MKIKLRQIGNSYGFVLPKEALIEAGFSIDDDYDIDVSEGAIALLKKIPANSAWRFSDSPLSDEAKAWLQDEANQS